MGASSSSNRTTFGLSVTFSLRGFGPGLPLRGLGPGFLRAAGGGGRALRLVDAEVGAEAVAAPGALADLGAREIGQDLAAFDAATHKITWQKQMPRPISNGSGAMTTAGGLLFHGEPDGNFQAYDVKNGDLLWQFQTGAPAAAPASTYEIDGKQYVAIYTGDAQSGTAGRA